MPTQESQEIKKPKTPKNKKADNKNEIAKRLYRSKKDRILGGVCGGIAEFFDIDSFVVRTIFILLAFFGGSGFLIYILLWILIPNANSESLVTEKTIKENTKEMQLKAYELTSSIGKSVEKKNSRKLIGFTLITFGAIFLLSNLGILRKIDFEKFWPIILIVLGFAVIFRD